MIEKLREQLIEHEGMRRYPYRCTAGKLTIGVGRNIQERGISEAEAIYLLNNDIEDCVADCHVIFPDFDSLTENRQVALLDLRFNLGPGTFRTFKRMIAAVRRGDYASAAVELKKSRWSGQVGKSRSGKIIEQMRDG